MAEYIADGSVLKLGQGDADTVLYGDETFDTLGQITDFTLPGGGTRPTIDTTDIADSIRTYQKGILDGGEGSFTVNYDTGAGTTDAYLQAALVADTPNWLQVTFSDGTTIRYWKVLITSVGTIEGSEGGKLTQQFSFKGLTTAQTPA